jgi:hypothetical protein
MGQLSIPGRANFDGSTGPALKLVQVEFWVPILISPRGVRAWVENTGTAVYMHASMHTMHTKTRVCNG